MHPAELIARKNKADAIADCPALTLTAEQYTLAADQIDAGNPEGIYAANTIAWLAGVTPPSARTLRLVAFILHERAATADNDPFSGLPR